MENNKDQKISTPAAIIVAGVLIMLGIILSKNAGKVNTAPKTLSEQVGVSKDALTACIKATDVNSLNTKINESVEKAMSDLPNEKRGTPFSVVIGPNNFKAQVLGYASYDDMKKVVDQAALGKIATTEVASVENGKTVSTLASIDTAYQGKVELSEEGDHITGNPNAQVTIIEYSDFECPFCKQFQPVLAQLVKDGNVRWIYRHYPLHQHSFEKLTAAECIAKIKGNDAFWKYGDLLFSMLKTANDSVSEEL